MQYTKVCFLMASGNTLGCAAFPILSTTVLYLSVGVLHMPSCTSGSHLGVLHSLKVYNSHHVHQEPHLVYCICQQVYCICHYVHQEAHWWTAFPTKSTTDIMFIRSLTWCTVFASRRTAYAIMYIRKHTWVYCIPSSLQQPSCASRASLGVLYLSVGVLHMPSCTSGSHLGVLHSLQVYNSHHVLQEPHLVYCICQQVYCICHYVHQEAHWWTAFPTKSTTDMFIKSLTWCTVFASRCTAYAIMYIRKHTWVYCIPLQVYNSHHVHQEPHLVYCIC